MELERIQKFIANTGFCSRRKAEELISQGRVKVNGKILTEMGAKIDPEVDEISVDEKVLQKQKKYVYILLNKPIGYVTTVQDQFSRPTVLDLIKNVNVKVLPVGRLDMFTSGALILTNDGSFIFEVTHPKHEIDKTYQVTLSGIITQEEVKVLEDGVHIDNYITGKAKVKILKIDKEKNQSRLQITIHEGKNKEVRKMCNAIRKRRKSASS